MKIAEQVSIAITEDCSGPFEKGKHYLLDVEEFHPYEPSAYVHVPGWGCAVSVRGISHWFFVDEAGAVWYNGPEDSPTVINEYVGLCPAQEAEYNAMLKQLEESTSGVGWPE